MNSILVLKVSLLGLFALSVLSCGGNLKSNYPSGAVPCREETIKIVEVINPATGKKWMYRNLGASKVAEWVDDPEAYGELYQWGRFPDGHQCRRSDQGIRKATSQLPNVSNYWHGTYIMVGWNPNDWLSPQNDELWQGISGLNNPCPKSFRIPNNL